MQSQTDRYVFNAFGPMTMTKGENPQRDLTEIIIEIKQFYTGQMAPHPFIASYHMYNGVSTFTIDNGLLH